MELPRKARIKSIEAAARIDERAIGQIVDIHAFELYSLRLEICHQLKSSVNRLGVALASDKQNSHEVRIPSSAPTDSERESTWFI